MNKNIDKNTPIEEVLEVDYIIEKSKKFGIKTIGDMLKLSKNEFDNIYEKDTIYLYRNIIAYNIPITDLHLSSRATNALKWKKISTIGELLEYSITNKKDSKYLGNIRNLGQATLAEIIKKVHNAGYFFKDESQLEAHKKEEEKETNIEQTISENNEIRKRLTMKKEKLNQIKQLTKEKQELLKEEQELDKQIAEALEELKQLTGDKYVKAKK